jgi:hypothetical protein
MVDQQGRTLDLEFVGGLITGEGSFCLSVNNLKNGKTVIRPAFYMQMDDIETIELVASILKSAGQPPYVHRRQHKSRPGIEFGTVQYNGFKRVSRLISTVYPHLYGTKKRAAKLVQEFIYSRTQQPPNYPYTERELEIVAELRATNGNRNGKKNPVATANPRPIVTLRGHTLGRSA